ncbi:outer membrane protein [Desulfobulbus oligotrophicus]|uniref:Porin family protein n=1 Tax=Desulfobulbus oligotrophicus TaxID=1909699 RepID=A0A7T6ARF3_9BACT|nr:outer membrane beta-barrel protein [Desulfobulbus oligotrophicus]QQG66756.1 porin family protein [Desulfobulbus oligotrophicus]
MKKVLSVMAVSAFVLTAGNVLAGGPSKQYTAPGCPDECQQQIDDLNSSQAQQDELLSAHGKQLQNHESRITDLERAFDDYWYARLGIRAAWVNQKMAGNGFPQFDADSEVGFGGAIAFGREFAMYNAPGKFRAEIELAKQVSDIDDNPVFFADADGSRQLTDGEIDITTVMINGYYELPVFDAFSVYAMAGVGFAKYDVDATITAFGADGLPIGSMDGGASDNVFAYKAGAGVTYNFTDEIAADLGYEYLGVADTDIADSINGHNVVASVRFKF